MANVKLFVLTVSSIDYDLVSRFHVAAQKSDVSTMKQLLEEGVPVDCVNNNYDQTALFDAALYNRTDVIRLLLQYGTNIKKRNRLGNTPVHYAAINNSTEAIALLAQHGAPINIKNDNGDKPIDVARQWRYKAAICMLEQL